MFSMKSLSRFAASITAAALSASAFAGGTSLDTVRVASGLTLPLHVTAPEGDFSRLFIVEQRSSGGVATRADIRILNLPGNTLNATPYLSISPVATGNEQGLLGMAFHPDFLNNGYFFVHYSSSGGATVIARYQASAPFATSTSANPTGTVVLSVTQPFTNHNGGWIGFGPDGYLYISLGDGGSANDPGNRAQTITNLLGKMLRIDVDGADNFPGNDDDDGIIGGAALPYTSPPDNPFAGAIPGSDEIWAYGLRNAFRCSFDRLTGELYMGDVGQDAEEEISWQPANTPGTLPGQSGYQGGRNYGWKCYEGNLCKATNCPTCPNAIPTAIAPIATYRNSGGGAVFAPFSISGCSVTGGYVYRGCAIPDLQGTYFFTDYCTPTIFSFRNTNGVLSAIENRTTELAPGGGLSIGTINSFGEDAYGELYIVDQGGEVFKIIPAAGSPLPADCNNNLKNDACDIADGTSLDVAPANGIPDECEVPPECPGDANGDNQVDGADLSVLLGQFGDNVDPNTGADFNGDGQVDGADLSVLLGQFGNSCV